eukprot:CAMPEP_0181450544 /NCGR_PEP_ID=MMETSP1110-20121109/28230_1 /TAXON_ID=174948 /ORGANISM="Symbiodinium sp., Strain CCMP421" /LENGTH=626 /DNA_ID=CAMNT_0023574767 /DNA_START=46 /DNA_END=1922 /DNA_ORIENTATION=+
MERGSRHGRRRCGLQWGAAIAGTYSAALCLRARYSSAFVSPVPGLGATSGLAKSAVRRPQGSNAQDVRWALTAAGVCWAAGLVNRVSRSAAPKERPSAKDAFFAAAEVFDEEEVDVAVIGAGPGGTLLAYLLAEQHGRKVCLIDPAASKKWPNNYGVWQAEWDALAAKLGVDLNACLQAQWKVTDCYFGGSWELPVDNRLRLDRPYARVDRAKLKQLLRSSPNVKVIESEVECKAIANNVFDCPAIRHSGSGSVILLADGSAIRTKLIVDSTGFESSLTRRLPAPGQAPGPAAGYQIAYGCEVIVDGDFYYAPEAMTLFDYRTDHLSFDKEWEQRAEKEPTFIYVMPLGPVPGEPNAAVFFEETSLVARPAISFEECKQRCFARLRHLGVSYREETISDEEFCYIPMGGNLPEPGQRIVAFGAAAAMVHPSTGYQLCRMMASSKDVADTIAEELAKDSRPDAVAAAAYEAIWSPQNQAQRDFAVFGGEFLMELDVAGLRGWFQGFFNLPEDLWAGFLAGWPSLPGNSNHESWFARLTFGLQLVTKIPPPVVLRLMAAIGRFSLTYGVSLIRSVTPLFGSPPSYAYTPPVPKEEIGDVAAKREAMEMMKGSAPKIEAQAVAEKAKGK